MAAVTGAVAAVAGVGASVLSSKSAKDSASAGRKSQEQQNEKSAAEIAAASKRAKEHILEYMPKAQQMRGLGAQSAMDIFGAAAPAQFNAFQQGNTGAQSIIHQGMQQQQNALLGLPVDYGTGQPVQFTPDFSFMPTEIPAGLMGFPLPEPVPVAGQQPAANGAAAAQNNGQHQTFEPSGYTWHGNSGLGVI